MSLIEKLSPEFRQRCEAIAYYKYLLQNFCKNTYFEMKFLESTKLYILLKFSPVAYFVVNFISNQGYLG